MREVKSAKGRATCADIARMAGVSKCTVSLLLNNHPNVRVSENTRKRIHDAIKKLDYRPNAVAKALSTGRTNSIGILIFHVGSPFTSYATGILDGIWEVAHRNSMRMTIDSVDVSGDVSKFQREAMVDGIIMLAPPVSVKNLKMVLASGFPVLCVGSKVSGIETDYVDLDNFGTAKNSVMRLIRMGHRDIIHISGPVDGISSAKDRLEGYKAALAEAGISFRRSLVISGNYLFDSGRRAVSAAMEKNIKFSAIFAANDSMAYGAASELLDRGIKIPNDISIAGIDADNMEGFKGPSLMTTRQPLKKIGEVAGELIVKRIEAGRQKPRTVLMKGDFIEGGSIMQNNKQPSKETKGAPICQACA